MYTFALNYIKVLPMKTGLKTAYASALILIPIESRGAVLIVCIAYTLALMGIPGRSVGAPLAGHTLALLVAVEEVV